MLFEFEEGLKLVGAWAGVAGGNTSVGDGWHVVGGVWLGGDGFGV